MNHRLSTMILLLAFLATLPFWSNVTCPNSCCGIAAGASPCCAPANMGGPAAGDAAATGCCGQRTTKAPAPSNRDLPPCRCDDTGDIPWNMPPATPQFVLSGASRPATFAALVQPIGAADGVRPCRQARSRTGPPPHLSHCVFLI